MNQTMESLHVSIAQIIADVKGLAACVTSLSESKAECSEKMDQILTCVDVLEGQMNKFEGIVNQGISARASKSSGGSRGVSNEHPLLKVCRDTMSPMLSVLKTLAHGAYYIFSDVWCGRDREQGQTYQ